MSDTATMRVLGINEFGGADSLAFHHVPRPQPGAKQARIRVRAAAVNPADIDITVGNDYFTQAAPPHIPGMDAAGFIDMVGPGSIWNVGDAVMTMALPLTEHGGAYAEYLVAPDDSIARIPSGRSYAEAATLPMNGLTATLFLEVFALNAGDTIAVTGAAGALGGYIVQFAKLAGLTVIADAAPKDVDLIRSFGADHILERGDGLADRIRAIFPHGVDAVADAASLLDTIVPAVRDGGTFASVRGWVGSPTRGIRFEAPNVYSEYRAGHKLDAIRQAAEDGHITTRVADIVPSEDAASAHRRLAAGGLRGRILLSF